MTIADNILSPALDEQPLVIDPATLGFDFDGVIANTAAAFVRIAREEYACSFTLEDITSFDIENCIAIEAEVVNQIFTDIMSDSLATRLQPMAGAIAVLTEIASLAPITIITARALEQPVIAWCDRFFPPATRQATRLIAMGDHNDKLRYIRSHNLRYFIDDRAETCAQLAAADIVPIVYSQPWNRNRHAFSTVESWPDIRALLPLP